MERFACETTVVSGEGALSVLGEQQCRRLLVLTEPSLHQAEPVRQIVKAAGNPETAYLDNVGAEPTMMQAIEGSQKVKQYQPDLVVALGSRNVLDWGKAMTCFSRCAHTLAVIPTTFGSGEEVTDQVILTHNGHRHLLRDRAMRPDLAILDSSLTVQMSQAEIREGGFEQLATALEAYTSAWDGPLRDLHAREAFVSGWAALPGAYSGNALARRRMQIASVLTGFASNRTDLGLCRAMENSLGVVFGLSRGTAAGILLPAIVGCNAHAAGRKYAELSRAAGLGGSSEGIGLRNLKSGLLRLRRELNLPGTLVQAGVDIRRVWSSGRRIVELTLEDPACRSNPVAVDDFLVRRILEEITGRI